jgi:prepilin-type N-terminal cleavage/methylation domain-containing protein
MRLPIRRAFTVIELLMVSAIIAVPIAPILSAAEAVREATPSARSANDVKYVDLALSKNIQCEDVGNPEHGVSIRAKILGYLLPTLLVVVVLYAIGILAMAAKRFLTGIVGVQASLPRDHVGLESFRS